MALILAFVFLPYVICRISNKRYQALLSPEYREKFGALYAGLRVRNRKAEAYLKSLTFRRLIFCFFVMLMRSFDYAGLQWVLIIIFAILLPSINNLAIRVNLSRRQNRLELFNEWACGNVMIFSCLFTEILDLEMRFNVGWYVVIVTAFCLLVNAYFIFLSLIKTIKLQYKKYMRAEHHAQKMAQTSENF